MPQVDFYHLTRDPAEQVAVLIARKVFDLGERLLVVSADEDQRAKIDRALWHQQPGSFLGHGNAGEPHAGRQPILIADGMADAPENAASHVILADGRWRDDAAAFERSFLLFDEAVIDEARACWRGLGSVDGLSRNYWKQDGGRWVKAA